MKPLLTFTDYIENTDNKQFSVELVATVNQKKIVKAITRPIPLDKVDSTVHSTVYRNALETLVLNAVLHITNNGGDFPSTSGMTLSDKLSMFEVKQTVGFNNAVHSHSQETSVIMAAIW